MKSHFIFIQIKTIFILYFWKNDNSSQCTLALAESWSSLANMHSLWGKFIVKTWTKWFCVKQVGLFHFSASTQMSKMEDHKSKARWKDWHANDISSDLYHGLFGQINWHKIIFEISISMPVFFSFPFWKLIISFLVLYKYISSNILF